MPRLPLWLSLRLRLARLCRLRLRLGMLRILGPLPLVLGVGASRGVGEIWIVEAGSCWTRSRLF